MHKIYGLFFIHYSVEDMELHTRDNNMYNRNFINKVRNDELQRSSKLYEKANNPIINGVMGGINYAPIAEQDSNEIVSITGEKLDKKQFKHNNMQPFIKGNITQNTDVERFTTKLDMNTGVDKFYIKKQETQPFFKPMSDMYNINGAKQNSEFYKSRIELPKINNNVFPKDKIYVGPGLNKGYTSTGTGGFQQSDTFDYARPRTLEELRSKVNQKETVFQVPFQAPVKGTDQRGIAIPYSKNKPETTYKQTEENWFKTTGAVLKERERPSLAVKATARPDMHIEYSGGAKLENVKGFSEHDDYGKANVMIYNNQRQETQTRTVISNVTSTIKAIMSPVLDAMKYTIKEYLVDAPRAGGNPQAQIPNKASVHDPTDTMKTTIKETTVQDTDNLNLTGPSNGYSAAQDEAKTTVKETLIHDGTHLNLKGADKTYLKADGKTKTTLRETLIMEDTSRNIGAAVYKVYMYNPENAAKRTVKETTIKSSSDLGFIGGVINSLLGAYASSEVEVRNTHKQFTSDHEEYGIAQAVGEFRQSSREATDNAEINGAREQLLINAAQTPNGAGPNIPIDKSDVTFLSNKLVQDSYSVRDSGNINTIYQQPPQLSDDTMTRTKLFPSAFDDRLDSSILEPLKDNDLSIIINPI
jgi:hypothetical protein